MNKTNSEAIAQPAPYLLAHGFRAVTREYTGPVRAWLSPLDGVYPLPADAVIFAPDGVLPEWHSFRLAADGTRWESVPDYRVAVVWDINTQQPTTPPDFGVPLPETSTLIPPLSPLPAKVVRWDVEGAGWVYRPDYSEMVVRETASGDVVPSPAPGEPLPPGHTVKPWPLAGLQQAVIWRGDDWQLVPDHRQEVWYGTADGQPCLVTELGEVAPNLTPLAPPSSYHRWIDGRWQIDGDSQAMLQASSARLQRDALLEETEWFVTRHRDQLEMSLPTTLTREAFGALLAYRQTLRDVPLQPAFPEAVQWPAVPDYITAAQAK
ncbi:phage tail assembly chaperone [Chromobacterium vaccinii]|uniref:phage tail assembly chaperone n=1 Tax=Chromobacterium vaccinii TaxID=1108595 RepID=UPI003C74A395